MQNFTKRIEIEQGFNPIFIFNRIFTVSGIVYFISGTDKDRVSRFFQMKSLKGRWKILDRANVAAWIVGVEEELEKAILEKVLP